MSDQSKISNNQPLSEVDKRLAAWRKEHSQVMTIMRRLSWLVLTVVSPTFRIASCLKPVDEGRRSIWIVTLNVLYLATALLTVAGLTFVLADNAAVLRTHDFPLWWLWAWFLWSRCAEVLIAFYRDAIEQLISKTASSDLTAAWRVKLALNSYVELIVNYALIYTLLPEKMWCSAPARISESLWISASTITTSGNAGFAPASPLLQFLMTCEIVGGVILLVVCFALYAGGKADERRPGAR
ncbi:hypothetical protein U1763_20325 [Sphingomonas sp. LB2R24]|uniref:hypothetical protein n=1 Tax=Sphingomonas sorbitolis TaxID=3096165 RepID=UPI002FC8AC64